MTTNNTHLHLSLKFYSSVQKDAGNLKGISSIKSLIQSKELTSLQKSSFENIRNQLKDLSPASAVERLNKLNLNPQLSQEILQAASNNKILKGSADEVANAMSNLGSTGSSGIAGLGSALSTAGTALKTFATSATGILTIAVGIGAAVVALEDYFTVDYGEALETSMASIEKSNNSTKTLEGLNNELSITKARIAELKSLKDAGTISVSEDTELSNLQRKNIELERNTQLQKKTDQFNKKQAAEDAELSLKKKGHSVAQSIRAGDTSGQKNPKNIVGKVTTADAIKEDVALYKDYENKIKEHNSEIEKLYAEQKKPGSQDPKIAHNIEGQIENKKKEIEKYQEALATLNTDITDKTGILSTQKEALLKGGGDNQLVFEINEALSAVDKLNNTNVSKSKQKSLDIEDFFSSKNSSGIKDYLTEVAKTTKSTDEIKSAIKGLGLTSKDFGSASLNDVSAYFMDIANSAEKASDSAQKVNGSFSGISEAFQTENAGDAFEDTGNYLQKAKEQFDKGLVGTDDVKAVAKMIGAKTDTVDNLKATFNEKYQEALKYFTFDEGGNLTEDGINTFTSEFEALQGNFESTGEAAKAMNMSAEQFEILMGRAQDHGIDFGNMIKSSEELEEAKTSLSGLKDIYGELGTSDKKDAQIAEWEEQLAQYEGDLSQLDPSVTAKIKFEYDLAELQQKMEESQAIAENGGDSSDWAAALADKQNYRSTAEEGLGFGNEDFGIPQEYQDTSSLIANLQEQLQHTADEEGKLELQMEIGNLYDIQNDLLDAFSETYPEINADSSIEETSAAWEEFMENISAEDLVANLDINDEDAIEKISEIFGISEEELIFAINAEDNASEVVNSISEEEMTDKIVQLIGEDDATPYINLWNYMSTDPKFAQLSAEDQATMVLNTYNGLSAEDKDSLISQSGGEATKGVADAVYASIKSIPPSSRSVITVVKETINKVVNWIESHSNATTKAQDAGISSGSKKKGSGPGGANGTAHSQGTALWQYRRSQSRAFSGGNWGLKQSEQALVNELGGEIIVRNGRWFMMNNGYPTFADLKAGDIIFNHRQSEALLNHGYVTGSHARLIGSARVNGSASSLAGKAYASGTQFKDQFDQIEILLDRMETAFKRISDSVETLSYNLTAQNQHMDQAISAARNNISSYQRAYDAYMNKANGVGLADNWKNAVQNGDYSISEITDKDLNEKIDNYKKYYEKALHIQKDIADLQKDLIDLAVKKLKNIDSYFSNRFDYNDDFGYATQIEELQRALDQYINELNSQVSAGTIKQFSDEWYDAQKKIADYTQKVLEATWKKFENTIDYLSRASDNLKDLLSLKEAKGENPKEEDYQKQITMNNESIDKSYAYRQELLKKQAVYDVGSKLYDDLAKDISDLDSDIYKLMEDNEKLKKSIWEVRFTNPFEQIIDGLDETMSSTKNLRSLLDKDAFFDSSGGLTDTGLSNLALLNHSMAASRQKIAEYTTALHKLDEAYQNGIITQKDYEKSQKSFLKEIQDSAGDVQDYKEDIIDMYKDQLKAESKYMEDYYDKREKSLDLDKKYYEFSKKMSAQSKSVNQIKAQIAALQGANNASAQAELKRLQEDLAKEEEDLSEIKRDHASDMQGRGFDKLRDGLDETLDNTLNELTYNADMQEQVVADMLNNVVQMYGQAYDKINQIISGTGFIGNSGFNQNISGLETQYGAQDQVSSGTANQGDVHASGTVTNVDTSPINKNPSHDSIVEDIQKEPDITNRLVAQLTLSTSSVSLEEGKSATVSASVRPTDATNKTLRWASSNTSAATVSGGTIRALKPGNAVITCYTTDESGLSATVSVNVTEKKVAPPPPAPPSPGPIPFHYKKDYYPKNRLNTVTSIVDRLKSHDFDSSMSACRELYNYWGGSGYYTGTYSQNVWLLSKMKSAGYKKGSHSIAQAGADFIHDGEIVIRKSDGGMLVPLKRGDGVIPSGLTENLWNLAENAPELLYHLGLKMPASKAMLSSGGRTNIHAEFNFDTLLNIEGNADNDIVDKLKSALPQLGKDLTRIVSTELAGDYRKLK